jgi:protease-4
MDYEQDNNFSDPIEPLEPAARRDGRLPTREHRKTWTVWKVIWWIIMVFSVMANFVLFLLLVGVITIFTAGHGSLLTEEVLREGPVRDKIAVITVQGIIYGDVADDVYGQLKAARQDHRVKGLIVRVNSPGGTVSASDQIYKQISEFRDKENKPVIAFMQGVAASGGYYTSVACEKIIAEPTVITGSIGVISSYLVVQELLEEKLGVQPVTIKSGQKKDWPSYFRSPSPEEIQYMQDKLIKPAYDRFVQIVAEGRKSSLTLDKVKELADGSIFGAQEAFEVKLIDDIGYLDEAIELVKSMAGIKEAQVIEYRKPFSISDILNSRKTNMLKIDRNTLYEISTPQILYLWSAY